MFSFNLSRLLTFTGGFISRLKEEMDRWRSTYWIRRPVLLALAAVAVSIVLFEKWGSSRDLPPQNPLRWEGRPGRITGVIDSIPDPRPNAVAYTVEAETIQTFHPTKSASSVSGRIFVRVSGSSQPQAGPGDRIETWSRLQKPSSARIPGTFDYSDFLRSRGVSAVVFTSSSSFRPLGKTNASPFLRRGWTIRQKMIAAFYRNLSSKQATVLSGLVVGQRPRFDPEIRDIFIRSGTMHVLVASGSNVAFLAGIWFLLVRFILRWNRRWALLTSLPVIWLYVNVVGQDPPIVRAGIMGTAAILSYLLLRVDRPYQAWAWAAVILLIKEPLTLFDIGFQMSFVTVFGLIYTLPTIEPFWADRSAWLRWPGRIASATAVAQIWILPITLQAFGKMYLVGFLSNVFVIPLSGAGLFVGFLLAICRWIAPLASVIMSFFIGVVSFFARHSGPCLLWMPPSPTWILGYYLVLFSLPFLAQRAAAQAGAVLGVSLLIGGWIFSPYASSAPRSWRLTWIDTGPRTSLLVETRGGQRLLINPGPAYKSDSSERILLPYFSRRGIRRLDAVLVTHRNTGRSAGLESLKRTIPIKRVEFAAKTAEGTLTFGKLKVRILPGSRSFQSEAPVLLSYGDENVLLSYALPLKTQRALMSMRIRSADVFQSRFSPKIRWLEEFVETFKPAMLVEAGTGSATRPSAPPWRDRSVVVPQQKGVWIWEPLPPSTSLSHKRNTKKTR